MKKYAALQIIALALAFILIAGVIVGVMFWQNGNISFTPVGQEETGTSDEETPNEEAPVPPIEATISDNEHIRLAMSAAVTAVDGEYVEQYITATVLPEEAPDKTVDWTVAWEDGSDTDIDNYVQVIPDADGSCNAAIRCYAAFEGTIVVTCVTRDGGFTATCNVTFVGVPSEIVFDYGDYELEQEGDVYILPTGKGSLQVWADFSNIFGSVMDDLAVTWKVGFEGDMTVNVTQYNSGAYVGSRTFEATDGVIPLLSDITIEGSVAGSINVIEEGVLSIVTTSDTYFWATAKSTVDNCEFNLTSGSVRRNIQVVSASGYITLTAECSEYDIQKTIKIRVDSSVNGVSLSENAIVF